MSDTKEHPVNEMLNDEENSRQKLGGIGHTKFYQLIRDGELRSVRIGRRRFVPQSEIDRFIAGLHS